MKSPDFFGVNFHHIVVKVNSKGELYSPDGPFEHADNAWDLARLKNLSTPRGSPTVYTVVSLKIGDTYIGRARNNYWKTEVYTHGRDDNCHEDKK